MSSVMAGPSGCQRLYYLAAVDVEPFDDQQKLVDVLTYIWMSALYPSAKR